jgi:hypothetical protein
MDHTENERIRGETQAHRQRGDLISLITKIREDTQTDGET